MSAFYTARCAGCRAVISRVSCAGIWIKSNGQRLEYVLCESCATKRKRDPDCMRDTIERNLSSAGGDL